MLTRTSHATTNVVVRTTLLARSSSAAVLIPSHCSIRNFAATASATTSSTATSSSSSSRSEPPGVSAPWGPRTRYLMTQLPPQTSRRTRTKEAAAAAASGTSAPATTTVVRKLPMKYTRLEDDLPNSRTHQYELHSAVVIERWPKVLRDQAKWRTEYEKHFAQLRQEQQGRMHGIPAPLQAKPEDAPLSLPIQPAAYNPADLLTQADRANDLHATHRCLQDSLFLVVKRRGGTSGAQWSFPSNVVPFDVTAADRHVPDAAKVLAAKTSMEVAALLAPPPPKDTLRTVGAAACDAIIGTHAGVYFMGNAPIAVHRVKKQNMKPTPPLAIVGSQKNSPVAAAASSSSTPVAQLIGTKTFFMHALYLDGEIRLNGTRDYDDYAWIKKDEFEKYLGKEQAELLNKVLIEPQE